MSSGAAADDPRRPDAGRAIRADRQPAPLRSATTLRDAAIVITGAATATLQGFARSWVALAVALLAAAAWIALRRVPVLARPRTVRRNPDIIVSGLFLVLGVLTFRRLVFSLLPLAVAAMWTLLVAADLDRFVRRYPAASATRVARARLTRRLQIQAIIGAASAITVTAVSLLDVRLRIVAVMLLAAFVVVTIVRVARSVDAGE